MKRVLLICAVLGAVLLTCSEKCPLEPCRDTCEDLYGDVCLPEGYALPARELRVRSLTGACALERNLSFCLPALKGTGTGVLAVTFGDTVPVMLGYVFPHLIPDGMGGEEPLDLGPELRTSVRTASGGVKLSVSSTALALVMLNPFFGGTTVEERAWFASRIARHGLFLELAADVEAAMEASPADLLDSGVNPKLYEKAASILEHLVCLEVERPLGQTLRGPYAANGPGDNVELVNLKFASYGVTVVEEGASEPDTVFLLPGRGIRGLAHPADLEPFLYLLGTGRFRFEFFKGFKGFPASERLNPAHPGGLATIANTENAIRTVVTMLAGSGGEDLPGKIDSNDAPFVDSLSEMVESGEVAEIVDLTVGHVQSNPEELSDWFGEPLDDLVAVQRFMAATRGVISTTMEHIEASNAKYYLHFYQSLTCPVHSLGEMVCQRNGYLVPCERDPMLRDGEVSPEVGYTDSVFTFSVCYRDLEGQPPEYIAVLVDGVAYSLTLAEGEEADGVYSVSTELPAGTHTHYFECRDTHGDRARLPRELFFYGPIVMSYPELRDGRVLPSVGSINDEYAYRVHYSDADRDAPDFVRVIIDGQPYEMSLYHGRSYDGGYEYRARLEAGGHTYHFECSDSTGAEDRHPEVGESGGPAVSYAPELSNGRVYPISGSTSTEFKYEVDYYHRGGLPPSCVKVYVDGFPRYMTLKSGLEEDGTYCFKTYLAVGYHTCYFEAADTLGLLDRLPRDGVWHVPTVRLPEGKNPNAKVAVHVRAHDAKARCDYGAIERCLDIISEVPDISVDAFPVFFDLTEYIGVEYGLTWPEWTYSGAWTSCSDLAVGKIRNPGEGASHSWHTCQSGVAVPGYIWLYADGPGMICVCEYPLSGGIYVWDCEFGSDSPVFNACAGVRGVPGDDACPP